MSAVPLSILDLAPIVDGSGVAEALGNTIDLAQRAEAFGYHRYWLAEHHFAEGVASSAPAVLIAAVAAATGRIRVGSGAVQVGHQTALSVVEQFGTLDALYPGRIDLGLGRSGQRRVEAAKAHPEPPADNRPAEHRPAEYRQGKIVEGLLIPQPFDPTRLFGSPRFAAQSALLYQPGAQPPDFADQVEEILALLAGTYRSAEGVQARVVPGEGADLQVWILGSSAGQSAQVAGAHGLPFGANYHVSPATILEAVEAYRAAFKPSTHLAEPYVIVSADVVVADDDAAAHELASPYGLWVRSIRSGNGAMRFPAPPQVAAHRWSAADRALVADRIDTQFVGTPSTVAGKLRVLRRVTGADELLVTTITHDHPARVRSFDLLATEWGG